MADLSSLFSGVTGDLSSLLNELTSGFSGGTGASGGLGGLLSGVTGSTNPLYDIMALLSFVNEANLTQEQSGFMSNVLNQQKSALNTAMDPNAISAYRTAETPAGWSPQQFSNVTNQLTHPLSNALTTATLNPVQANLAAQGQNESAPTQQFVSQQALAPYQLQEQQMGQQGAESLLNNLLSRQGIGQQSAEFGLGLPNATPYGLPNFSVGSPPTDWTSLLESLGSGGNDLNGLLSLFSNTGSNFGQGFGNDISGLLQNQFLPGVA